MMTGVRADDRYVEACWLPVIGPTTFMLLRQAHRLAGPVGSEPMVVPCQELSRMVGLGASERPTRNNPIGKAMWRAHQFGVGWCDLDAATFELAEPLPLVPARLAANLPVRSWQYHAAHIDALTDRLAKGGIEQPGDVLGAADNARRALRNRRAVERLDGAARAVSHEQSAVSLG
jgi:hypothetical protein